MRNLIALRRAAWRLPQETTSDVANSKQEITFAVNASEQVVYLLHATSGRVDVLAIDDDENTPVELLVELSSAILTEDDAQWKWIEYVAELDAIVCGSTGGALAVVDLQTREPEEIGALDGGIVGMAWSSNQETLAIATGIGSLLVMNSQWEVLHETHLQAHLPDELSLPSKPAAAAVDMKWRDDAQYLVLNVEAEDTTSKRVRKVLVFTQQLELHAIGRLEDGRAIPRLGDTVDWSPNHSLITSHETRKDQLFVVFFEHNGLRHGEFALPAEYAASTTVVKQIQWNIQSDVVAVHVESSEPLLSRLLLWTRSNYHWYLKQEIAFDRTDDRAQLRGFQWDDERAMRLHVLLSTGRATSPPNSRYEQLEFVSDVSSGKRRLEDKRQSSVVSAVVDGHKLLLTPLHQALVPPPMALHTVVFAAPVNSVAFDAFRESLAVALSNGDVVLVDDYLAGDSCKQRKLLTDASITGLLYVRTNVTTGATVLGAKTGSTDALAVWSIDRTASAEVDANAPSLIPSDDVVGVRRATEIVSTESGDASLNAFALQRGDGAIVRVAIEGDDVLITAQGDTVCSSVFSRLEAVQLPSHQDDRLLTIGLTTATSKIFVDGVQVMPAACSSFHFCAFSSVLLFTTLGNNAQLRLVPLAAMVSHTFDANDESRVIERGARLIAVIGDRASVVLQMPRGNLEGTSPRLLVLALVAKQIERLEYASALEMSRRHRLDLNLLVDYDAPKFLNHVAEHLVDSLLATRPATVTSDRLCLLITNLHVVDVWKTKYGPQLNPFLVGSADSHNRGDGDEDGDGDGDGDGAAVDGQARVNLVCQEMLRVMQARESGHQDALLLPLLTAAVKQSPPDFLTALTHVQQLLATSSSLARAKRAMKHLIFLTQVDTLFEEALGLYDLALVRFVATYSQRDPKDYMPFLDECEATDDELVRRYKIDVFLHRHAKALAHVSELLQRGDLTETAAQKYERDAAELVASGGLYDQALALFSKSDPNVVVQRLHRRVLELKAQYLASCGQFEDAGFVFLSINSCTEAMQAFKSARVWRMALAAASRALPQQPMELRAFAYELVQALVNQKRVSHDHVLAAARIYTEYCDDVDEAVALLVTHKLWDESVRVAFLHKRPDLIETDVETGVAVAYDAISDDIAQRQAEYVKHWKRLTTIREQKRLFKLHGIDGSRWESNGDGGGDGDSQSVVSGAASSVADSALSAASSMRSVGRHNSATRGIGNFSMKSLAAATSSHFYATQSQGQGAAAAAAAAAYKSKRYGGMPSRQERRRRIKEGSVEEEVHVALQLRENAPSAALRRETRDVLRALVFFGRTAKAETLQNKLSVFETTVRDEFPMLEMPATAATTDTTTESRTQTSRTCTEAVSGVTHGETEAAEAAAVAWQFPAFPAN